MAAVKKNGRSLQFASENLKDNHKIAITAIKNNFGSIEYVSKRLHHYLEINIESYRSNGGNIVIYMPTHIQLKMLNINKLIGKNNSIYFQKDFRIRKNLIINNEDCRKHFIIVSLCIQKILKKKNQFQILPSLCIEKIYKYIDILDLKPFIKSLKEK